MTGLQHPLVLALAYLVAALTAYSAIALVGRVRNSSPVLRRRWMAGGALALATGVWTLHFLGTIAWHGQAAVRYDMAGVVLAGLIALGGSAAALDALARPPVTAARLAWRALAMGAGLCAFFYAGTASLRPYLGLGAHLAWLLGALVMAIAAAGLALARIQILRATQARRRRWRKPALAAGMGAAMLAAHLAVLAAFPPVAAAITAGATMQAVDAHGLVWPLTLGTGTLLGLTLALALMDARMQSTTALLLRSLRLANAELIRVVNQDGLTHLPNRHHLVDHLERACAAQRGREADAIQLAVVFIGLDDFKPINDGLGHAVGDEVLKRVGEALRQAAEGDGLAARVGSDEFALVLPSCPGREGALHAAERVLARLRQPLAALGRPVNLTASAGVALFAQDADDHHQLLARANTAMQQAKQDGKNRARAFEPRMLVGAEALLHLQNDLRHSLAEDRMRLYLQPKVDARTHRVTGAEALLRWEHPVQGLLSPAVFLEAAERSGLIEDIGAWTISEACRIAAELQAKGHALPISVNLSARQFAEPDLVALVSTALEQYRVDPSMLWLEITEGTAMADMERSRGVLESLQEMGVGVAIDDFGTGYSSLGYLRTLKVQEIKLDRSFIADINSDADNRALVEGVVRLGHAVGMRVVVEGVETEVQRRMLKTIGADTLQGFLFGKPMPAEELFAQYLAPLESPAAAAAPAPAELLAETLPAALR
jgi:diguanylate cyclase (GGDEF)-like protein